ncbi:MAG: hypothetical protein LBC23_02570, partial [Coriobacteriales bacterium]|nr:hypothetical protein [Coriobacteriales bacterium]
MRKKKTISVLCALALVANLVVGASAFAEQGEAAEGSLEPAALSLTPLATSVSVLGTDAIDVAVPGTADVVNYVVLSVGDADYANVTYRLGGTEVTPSLVLDKGEGNPKIIKLAVPVGASGNIALVTSGADSDLNTSVTIAAEGVAEPSVPYYVYGETPMAFSEFFHDATAGVTAVEPTTTSFVAGGTEAEPELFIAAGTKSGTLYPGGISWATSSNQPAVDAISTATFGDSAHFAVSGAVDLNYSGADITTKAEGHAITRITAVDVAVNFDLLANATLLGELNEATDQSTAVLAKIADITWAAAADIYKPKYLFTDASWGKRDEDVVTAAGKTFPAITSTSTTYGTNWTTRQHTVNFSMTGLTNTDFWNNYLEYIYGGYIEDANGHREPLVWLQNLFSHRGHTNFDVSINDSIFERFSDLSFAGDFKIVVYAAGFEDIVLDDVHLADYINGAATIEQGTTFNVSPSDNSTWFEDAQLHIQGAASFNAAAARLLKGQVEVDPSLYSFEQDGSEIVLSFNAGFFVGNYQGSYTVRLVADTDDVKSKPLTFTVNRLVDWPTLNITGGAQGVANDENTPLNVPINKTVTLNNADL